jgi:hypothetical protein
LIKAILSRATGRRALVALLVLGAAGGAVYRFGPYSMVKLMARPYPLPEESSTAAPELATVLQHLGRLGREFYGSAQWWDMVNPPLIAVAGTLLLGWLVVRAGHERRIWRFAVFLPLIAGAADVAENMMLHATIMAFPDGISGAATLETATKIKLLCLMLVVPIALGLGAVSLVRAIRTGRSAET